MNNGFAKTAILGGIIGGVVIFVGTILLGEISSYEAKVLIEKSISGLNTLCNTVVLASATILALMLTLLGVGLRSNLKFNKIYYQCESRVRRVLKFSI
jgi:type IV secretory pathway ATPase VirB11/archaellum biosynthesis ATPase